MFRQADRVPTIVNSAWQHHGWVYAKEAGIWSQTHYQSL
jgi:hypothetical protein